MNVKGKEALEGILGGLVKRTATGSKSTPSSVETAASDKKEATDSVSFGAAQDINELLDSGAPDRSEKAKRAAEIKKLIEEKGISAYFDQVSSTDVANIFSDKASEQVDILRVLSSNE